jgi:perosamine synthetase
MDGVETPLADDEDHTRSWFVYVVLLDEGIDRTRVAAELAEQGIECGEYLPCIHLQPYMREAYGFAEGLCPVAEDASRRTLALPFFPQLEREDQERVASALSGALAGQ